MVDVDKTAEKNNVTEGEVNVLQQHELLVNEIESTDGHLATALKIVYESSNSELFFDCLENRIRSHDKQIEDMCNHHYQGFIQSVHSLLQVRSDVDKLKYEIDSVNSVIQRLGGTLLNRSTTLLSLRRQQENIEKTIELMNDCLPVFEMHNKLKKQLQNKRFYPALKSLQALEHTYLPQVERHSMMQEMKDGLVELRLQIKEASMDELRCFLEDLRQHSGKIGMITMAQTAKEHNIDMSSTSVNKEVLKRMTSSGKQPIRKKHMFSVVDFTDDSKDSDLQELMDFSPVHRCLHIHAVLGDKESFESYYRSQRKKQCRLVLHPSNPLSKKINEAKNLREKVEASLDFYKNYFYEIVGFFVVEDHMLHTSDNLQTQALLDESWESALSRILAVLRTNIGHCSQTEILLKVKNLLLTFCLTLRNYGFNANPLTELLLEIRDQYSEILRKRWMVVFEEIFKTDNYTPICVETQKEYQALISLYPYENVFLEKEPFPKTFPFSQFVPAIFSEVKKYIAACLEFSEDLQISPSDKMSIGNRLMTGLLQSSLIPCIQHAIKNYHSLVQLIQISINMEHLDHSCIYLEDYISFLSGVEGDKTRVSKLHGQSMFKSAKSEAESEIYKQIDLKIDEFFELAEYDWEEKELPKEASNFINDIISFLRGIFQAFTNLPEKVAQTACMDACKHIADNMLQLLKNDEVKYISEVALHQINLDLQQCQDFALNVPVAGIDRTIFKMAFEDLRQLLQLFIMEDWASYFADLNKSNSTYLRVKPSMCIILMEKLKESEKRRSNLLSSFKRNERDKKKFFDTILKRLRTLPG